MNKKIWMIIAIIIVLLIGVGIFFYFKNQSSPNKSAYETDRISVDTSFNQTDKKDQREESNAQEQQESNSDTKEEEEDTGESEDNATNIEEEQIATFSTKIYSSDSARQNNIAITCDTLNNTIIKNGSTFSFCNTVGASSTSKGYQKADIFDKNGNKKKGLGGR